MLDSSNAVAARDGTVADEVEANGVGVTRKVSARDAAFVRAFNTMSYRTFAREANRPDPKLAVPIAGDDPEAVQVAAGLVRDAGLRSSRSRQAGRCETVSTRRSRLRPAGERSRA